MVILRGFVAVLIALLVTWIIGVVYEFYQPAFIPNPVDYKHIYPWFTGLSGLLGALIAVLLFGSWQVRALSARTPGKAQREPKTQVKAKPASEAKGKGPGVAVKTSEQVPGMPTFDIERGKADDEKQRKDKQP